MDTCLLMVTAAGFTKLAITTVELDPTLGTIKFIESLQITTALWSFERHD
jgi:hypothetical protein